MSLALVCLCAAAARADEPNLRLRIEWGGGEARQWQGELRLAAGEFSHVVPLGLEADAPGSFTFPPPGQAGVGEFLAHSVLEVHQRSPRRYDGLDVTVDAPLTSKLTITLTGPGGEPGPPPVEISLNELLTGDVRVDLDDLGSRLLVRRTPGDTLRVLHDHPTLVFAPGEEFTFRIDPHHAGLANDPNQRLRVALVAARDGGEIESSEHALTVTPAGDWSPIQHTLTLPPTEGAYDIVLAVERRNARLGGQFLPAAVLLTRKLQVVVVAETAPLEITPAPEQVVAELEPANPDFWERMRALPQLRRIPGIGNEPTSNHRWRPTTHLQSRWIELDANGWIAYPVPIAGRDQLHILEIEYPDDLPQTLGVSIVELNAAGEMVPPTVDTAVDVPLPPATASPGVGRHRIYFWPHTESPLVLLTNRRPSGKAHYGRIRILTGPAHLPPVTAPAGESGRQALAVFDRPLYPKLFSGSEGYDPTTQRSLDDWRTFLEGGNHLCEYLAHAGYGGAMIATNCEGSSLYPSELLQPTPKYDMGVFFATGQHPTRKDVLELLFRQFDRQGQTLVPIVQFTTPLPQLERLRQGPEAAGIELVDLAGNSWLAANRPQAGLAPYYNPLDPRVQQAMRAVVAELVERYGHHPSFGGVSLQLSAEGYAVLPQPEWGVDDVTLARFAQARGLTMPATPLSPPQRATLTTGENAAAWRTWRSQEMTKFYNDLAQVVIEDHPQTKFYLSGSRLIDRLETRISLRPTLPHVASANRTLLGLGVDVDALSSNKEIVFLRPRFYSPLAGLTESGPSIEFNRDTTLDESLGPAGGSAAFHAANVLSLPEFDTANPFGVRERFTHLMPIATPAGHWNRRRFIEALAARDTPLLVDGGWSIPLGQESALAEMLAAWRQLPAGEFEPPADVQAAPLVIRTLRQGNRRYIYILNNSRWSCTARLEIGAGGAMEFLPLQQNPGATLRKSDNRNYTAELPPYGMIAGYFSRGDAEVRSATAELPRGAGPELDAQLQGLRRQMGAIPTVTPRSVTNGGFELPNPDGDVPHWIHGGGQGVEVRVDPLQKQEGSQSLLISSSGPVAWVQSDPLELPNTGRLTLSVSLRTDDPNQQPQVRLAIFGRLHGRDYYKFAAVGAGQPAQLTQQWQAFELPILDLPPEGIEDLRVELDLMTAGKVWVDSVSVQPLPFTDNERFELSKLAALADLKLNQGNVAECADVLEGYWPRFLERHLDQEQPQLAAQPLAPIVPREQEQPAEAESEEPPVWERLRMPRLPWF